MREVAHDMQTQVTRFVSKDLWLVNSYDMWHGEHLFVMDI